MGPSSPSDRLLAIIRMQNEIAATGLDAPAIMALVLERARTLTGAAAAMVELREGEELVVSCALSAPASPDGGLPHLDSSLSAACFREAKTFCCTDAGTDPRLEPDARPAGGGVSIVCVPVLHAEETFGVLTVHDPRRHAFDEDDVATLELLSGVIASHLAHASALGERRGRSYHDPLTGLLNRPAFNERLRDEIARASRHGSGFALCLLDLDQFNRFNYDLGHAAGDEALRAIAEHLSALRGGDAAYRLAGEEFALVLIEASVEGVEVVIRRISASIQQDPRCQGVVTSWGATNFKASDDPASILARAQAALDAAKRPVTA
jgi:diguanylate cyclase (GGDEF)-like protein